jgi:hypothetical protein
MANSVAPTVPAIEQLNPLRHMDAGSYDALWQKLFSTFLYGFWGRFLFLTLIFLSFWFGVRMRNPSLAGTCIILAALVAYGAGAVTVAMSFFG